MKRENWNKLYRMWTKNAEGDRIAEPENLEETPTTNPSVLSKFKNTFKKKKTPIKSSIEEKQVEEKVELPDTELELKHYFLDNLLNFQMKWATSTVTHASFVHQKYYTDPLLKYLLQRFPDTYFIMYKPIFAIKKAPIEADIIFISPIGIEVVQFMDYEEEAVIMASSGRTWRIETPTGEKNILNPIISLKRTEKLIKSILALHKQDFEIKKTILSRKNNIIFSNEPYNTRIVGKINYEDWFQEKRKLRSPLKNKQIKAAEVLLKHCQTTSVKRPEWEEDGGPLRVLDMEE